MEQDAAKLRTEEGLLPPWLIYHTLVEASRVCLRHVCAVEAAWVAPTLAKLQVLDTARLARSGAAAAAGADAVAGSCGAQEGGTEAGAAAGRAAERSEKKGAGAEAISAAKARALARRAAESLSKRK